MPIFLAWGRRDPASQNSMTSDQSTSTAGMMAFTSGVLLGIVLIALVFVGPQTPWGWIGLVPLLTGLFRTCPLYSMVGANTCRK